MSWVNVAAEAGLGVAYPAIARHIRTLRGSQWRSADEIQEASWRALQATLRYAYDRVPFYREKFDRAGVNVEDIRAPADLPAIPPTTKQELREALSRAWPLSEAVSKRQASRVSTTGSSGEPFVFPIDAGAKDVRLAAVFRNIEWYGHRLGDRNARLWGRAERQPDMSVWAHGVEGFKRHILGRRLDIFTHDRDLPRASFIDEATLAKWTRLLQAQDFKALDGYVNALVLLARYVLDTGQQGIRCEAVVTGAEYLAPSARDLLERAFGCPVYNRYGSSEAGFIAHECGRNAGHKLHVNAELLWLEFLRNGQPVRPGELGEIVLTEFTNRAMPLIRYRTKDIGFPAPAGETCPCGRGLPLLNSVEGRVDDLFYLPGGEVLISHVWHEIFADQDFVSAFRVTQHRRDFVEVEIVPKRDQLSANRYRALQEWVRGFLPGCTVIWNEVDEIRPGAGGKLRSSRSTVASGF
jgi:phenylacetate-CoA ligase